MFSKLSIHYAKRLVVFFFSSTPPCINLCSLYIHFFTTIATVQIHLFRRIYQSFCYPSPPFSLETIPRISTYVTFPQKQSSRQSELPTGTNLSKPTLTNGDVVFFKLGQNDRHNLLTNDLLLLVSIFFYYFPLKVARE